MRGTAWTAKEDALLKQFAGQKTAEELAVIIGRPKNGVHHRIKKLGLNGYLRGEYNQNAKLSSVHAQMIVVLKDAGFTTNEIHSVFNDVCLFTICDVAAARTWRQPL